MYAMAAHWTFKAGSFEEALDVTRDEMVAALKEMPGFVRGFIVKTGADSWLSVMCWDTEDDAKRAMAELAPIAIRHVGHLMRGVERLPGPVVYEYEAPRRGDDDRAARGPAVLGKLTRAARRGSSPRR